MSIKLKSVVSKQLPDFVREDYAIFTEFMKAYYEYMDQIEAKDVLQIRDIDTTLDRFITYFKNELDMLGENYEYIDAKTFLKKSKQLFTAKGTQSSYKLLFRMMYDKLSEIYYPWDSVLKASDGKWQQENSLFVDIKTGDPDELVGNVVSIVSDVQTINVYVLRINYIENNVYEVFINKDYYGDIDLNFKLNFIQNKITFDSIKNVNPNTNTITSFGHGFNTGDIVTYSYAYGQAIGSLNKNFDYYVIAVDENTFKLAYTEEDSMSDNHIVFTSYGVGINHTLTKSIKGDILPTTVKYTIEKPGSGYKVGDIIRGTTLANGKEISQLLKVTKVDSNGGIKNISNVTFGYGYASGFYLMHSASQLDRSYTARLQRLQTSGASLTIDKNSVQQYSIPSASFIEKYTDYGYIINPNYVVIPYTDISYAAAVLEQFYNDIKTALEDQVDFCLIRFQTGAVAKYPGHYMSNDGFLDDYIYVQDSYKYQKYSYIISINEKLDKYKDLVKTYLHPAGTELFGEYNIENVYDFDESIVNKSTLELDKWQSKATIKLINKSIRNDKFIIRDIGGFIRKDPYDYDYALENQTWNPPLAYRFNSSTNLSELIKLSENITDKRKT